MQGAYCKPSRRQARGQNRALWSAPAPQSARACIAAHGRSRERRPMGKGEGGREGGLTV